MGNMKNLDRLASKFGFDRDRIRLVYVDYRSEESAEGALLKDADTDEEIERTNDAELVRTSVTADFAQGIVCAYKGVDGFYHLDHRLSASEALLFGAA